MRFLILAVPIVLLSACATPQDAGLRAGSDPRDVGLGGTPYGLFLAGQGALNDGRNGQASSYFDLAQVRGGDDELLKERAFTAAVLSGDVDRAASLAPSGENASEAGVRMGRLVSAVEAMAEGKGKAAQQILGGDAIGMPHQSAVALLTPWAAAQAGDTAASLARPQVRGDRVVDFFGQLGQAHLYERARRFDEAETDFKVLTGGDNPGDMVVMAYGGFLERRGRRAEALKLYDAAIARNPGDGALLVVRARAAAGKSAPPQPSVKEGAAQALLAPAASMLAAKQSQLGLAYLRLVLRLDPQRNEAWLLVGDLMSDAGDIASARDAYGRPQPGSPEYAAARAKLAWSYQGEGDKAQAMKLAREGAADGDADGRLTLADILRVNEQYAESAQLLTGLIDGAKAPNWRLLYARAISYEKLQRWPDAEADLKAALALQPDEPELLNYLGYSWIDRGEHLPEAMAMVQKAVAANPNSGAMVDSLGWAYYRLGDYKAAVEKLEEAIELEAGDPEINNHLGDAYWRVGRRDEAKFQWRRVLTLDPDARIKADAEAKLASGLGPTGPAVAPRVAGQ